MEFTVVEGDIAAQEADALVNAANTGLRMGSGVAGALRAAAGDELNDASVSQGPVDLGGVAVTDAFGLDADYVIHAAAMPRGGRATAESIRTATRNALAAADDLGCESLVLPALGCGVAGFDLAEGARLIAAEIDAFEPGSLSDVRVIGYGDEEYETIRAAAATVRGE
ncbi:MAG: macro domain-containing protein [Haloferacaceae archaeon]